MANREACELYIEQQIKEELAQGKKPWTIGKELSKWVEKLFEVSIKPMTIAQRAYRQQDFTNVKEKSNHIETIEYSKPEIIENRKPQGGGTREGAGRPKAVKLEPESDVFIQSSCSHLVMMAIDILDKISADDPEKNTAMDQMIEYCMARKEND